MTTSCLAFFSKAGIVAASDSDFSIRQISKSCPVAVAVNTYSPIPWKTIIDDYILENEKRSFSTIKEAYDSFAIFFKDRKVSASIFKKKPKENIFIFGFNENDLYPTLIGANIGTEEEGYLDLSDFFERNVSYDDFAFYTGIGDFDFVSPILLGITENFMETVQQNEVKLLSLYRNKLLEKVKGMPFENEWRAKLENFNIEEAVEDKLSNAVGETVREIAIGIDTFSIQEMVDYAEALVNAEVRLRRLKHKEGVTHLGTREIAVITIPEGLTWIKHHLFAI